MQVPLLKTWQFEVPSTYTIVETWKQVPSLAESVFSHKPRALEKGSISGGQRKRKCLQRRLRKMARDARKRKARDGTLEVREGKGVSRIREWPQNKSSRKETNTTIWFADSSMSKDSFMRLTKVKAKP